MSKIEVSEENPFKRDYERIGIKYPIVAYNPIVRMFVMKAFAKRYMRKHIKPIIFNDKEYFAIRFCTITYKERKILAFYESPITEWSERDKRFDTAIGQAPSNPALLFIYTNNSKANKLLNEILNIAIKDERKMVNFLLTDRLPDGTEMIYKDKRLFALFYCEPFFGRGNFYEDHVRATLDQQYQDDIRVLFEYYSDYLDKTIL